MKRITIGIIRNWKKNKTWGFFFWVGISSQESILQKEMESLTEKIHGHRNRYVNSNIHKMEIPKGERRKSGGRWVEAIMKEECFVGTLTPLSVYAESFVLSFSLINPIRLLKKKRERRVFRAVKNNKDFSSFEIRQEQCSWYPGLPLCWVS